MVDSPAEPERLNYYMISGSIMFTVGDISQLENVQPSTVNVNAIVRKNDQNFAARDLAKAQQNLHKSFVMKLPNPEMINVHDIVIMNISYLGYMSEEEFQAPPEGMKLESETITTASNNPALEA